MGLKHAEESPINQKTAVYPKKLINHRLETGIPQNFKPDQQDSKKIEPVECQSRDYFAAYNPHQLAESPKP